MPGPFDFVGAVAGTIGYGQKSKFRFANTWADGDTWSIQVTSTLSGDFTLGLGNIGNQVFTGAKTLRNRLYLSFGSFYAGSAVGDPTGWEEQDVGAFKTNYLSQYGAQDQVIAFASIQGRLAVFGERTVQIWTIDADPSQFALQQTLDNTGTIAQKSVQSIGDADVYYLHSSGIRSLRAKELSLNSSVNDIGTAIDTFVREALLGYDASQAVGIFEPTTGQYWLFLNGTIYVLSRFEESKVMAWSTFKPSFQETSPTIAPDGPNYSGGGTQTYQNLPNGLTIGAQYYWQKGANATRLTDTNGTTILTSTGLFIATETACYEVGAAGEAISSVLTHVATYFTPQQMVVDDLRIYIRASNNKIYLYGGTDNNSYDACPVIVETPWLALNDNTLMKTVQGLAAAFKGRWLFQMHVNPKATSLIDVTTRGSASSPSIVEDSTYDVGHYGFEGVGTHCKIKATQVAATSAKLCKLSILFTPANRP